MPTLKGKRTIIVNGVAVLLPLTDAGLMFLGEAQSLMPEWGYMGYAIGITALNAYLRSITTTPMGRSY